MLFLDGVYVDGPHGLARFRWVRAPTTQELTHLAHTIAKRVGRFLERQGLDERSLHSWLANYNTALKGSPINLITSAAGLIRTVDYVDAYRARV